MIRAVPLLVLFLCAAMPLRAMTEIIQVTSPGGITAWLVEDHAVPIIALSAQFKGGAVLDPAGKEGAVNMMAGLIEEGTGDLDATAFAEATERLAARFGIGAHRDGVSLRAQMLSENRDATIDLLARALSAPGFGADAIERVRGQVLSNLASQATDPGATASRAFNAALYGGHPYGRPPDGSAETVTALTREDIVAAHEAALVRNRLFVAVVGDITPVALGALLDQLFGALSASGPPLPGSVAPRATGETIVIDLEATQSVALFGHAGIARDDPDIFAAMVMNEVLGGGTFTSRLAGEIREKRGLTYGIRTSLGSSDYAATLTGSVASANENMAEVMQLVTAEWVRMADSGVTVAELEAAKRYLVGSYPLQFDGSGQIAALLAGLQAGGYPIDYVDTRNDQVRAVTQADVARVAKRLLQPEALLRVVVGRPVGLIAK